MEKNFWANKPRHKAIALVLLVCMLMTLVPAMAWAETTPASVSTSDEFVSAITSGSSIKLANDVTVTTTSALEIANGKNLTLDLNDYTLTLTSPSALTLNGNLTISDNGTNHTGKLVGGITNSQENNLTITGGTFNFNPTNYVDANLYDVTQQSGGQIWTVTKKSSDKVTDIVITAGSNQVLVGGNITLTATLTPSGATTGTSLTWASDKPDKITIDKGAAIGLTQTATVTLTDAAAKDDVINIWATNENEIKSNVYRLTVVDNVTPTLTLSPASMTLQAGESNNLTATLSPENTSAVLAWSVTAGQNVIQLDKTETTNNTHTVSVSALAAGTATISVSVKDDATIAPVIYTVTVTKEAPIPVTGITLDKPTLSLAADASDTVQATFTPSNANEGTTLSWTSNKPDVATVVVSADTHSATITGAGPGTATVTVSNGNVSTTCTVTVAQRPVAEMKLSSEQLNLLTNDTGNLTATLLPANATTGTTLTWESGDTAVVTVTPATDTHSAAYTAVGVGNATITVKSGSISATCAVVVTDTAILVNEITLDQTALALDLNGKTTGSIKATVAPENANQGTALTWTSSNSAVATVTPTSTTGTSEVTVTAVGAGETTITVSNGTITKECVVTVTNTKPEVNTIALSKSVEGASVAATNETLAVGAILGLNADLTGKNLSAVTVTWTSSDEAVAVVDENGAVTAKSSGTTKITATVDGQYTTSGQPLSASCDVEVTAVVIPPELQGDTTAQNLATNNAVTEEAATSTNSDISSAIGGIPANTKVYLDTKLHSIETDVNGSPVITFKVKPMKVQTIGEGGEAETETSVIDNAELNGAIKFRLPVPDSIGERYARIRHMISDTGRAEYLYPEIQSENGSRFMEVIVYKFSDFVVSFTNELPAEAPEATPNKGTGTYVGRQMITLTIPDGAEVYYTTDGSEPTVANATLYQAGGQISIAATTTLKVLVVHPDRQDGVYAYDYTIVDGGDDGIIDNGGDSGNGGSSGGSGGSTGGGGGTVVTPTNNDSWNNPYFDVSSTAWYYKAVKYATEKGLFSGVTDTRFGPNVSMTRGMLVTVLHKLEGRPSAGGNSFIDVPGNAYYSDAVAWAASKNIVSGIGDDMFAPGQAISREQLVVILYKYAQSKGMNTSASASLSNFADYDQVSPWAREAMQWAVGAGLISGKNGSILDPAGTATRAEVASILMNLLED